MDTRTTDPLSHFYENFVEPKQAEEVFDQTLSYVGLVTLSFSYLESCLDSILHQHMDDRSGNSEVDSLLDLDYISKVDMFERFSDELHVWLSKPLLGYQELIPDLRTAQLYVNKVVNPWQDVTNEDQWRYLSLELRKTHSRRYYVQYKQDYLKSAVQFIAGVESRLRGYWQARNQVIS